MDLQTMRQVLGEKGLSAVESLYVISSLQVPHIMSVVLQSDDGAEWEATYNGKDYYLDKVDVPA